MIQHTPGPWYVDHTHSGSYIRNASEGETVAVLHSEAVRSEDQYDANASLIAAAPAMLAALRRIATADYTRVDVATLGNIARAAIAQAEGKS